MTTFVTPTEWKSAAWWRNRDATERLFHARIPPRHLNKDAIFPVDAEAWVNKYSPGSNLYIHGKHGCGKSFLAAQLLIALLSKHQVSARFTPVDVYLDMLKDQFGESDNHLPEMYSSPYLVKYIQGVFDVVVLDGAGQERETEFSVHEVGSLLRRRHDDMRSVIITTTLAPLAFTRRYGERVASFMHDINIIRM